MWHLPTLPCSYEYLSAGAGQVSEAPPDLNAKPIQKGVIQECVRKWATDNAAWIGPWAYDGNKNIYAPKTLTDPNAVDRDGYQGFPVELAAPGRRFPSRYMCGPHSCLNPRLMCATKQEQAFSSAATYCGRAAGCPSVAQVTFVLLLACCCVFWASGIWIVELVAGKRRLKVKKVTRVTMEQLAQHLAGQLSEWPAQQLQALEIVVNSPFINNTRELIYACRTLFNKAQVCRLLGSVLLGMRSHASHSRATCTTPLWGSSPAHRLHYDTDTFTSSVGTAESLTWSVRCFSSGLAGSHNNHSRRS